MFALPSATDPLPPSHPTGSGPQAKDVGAEWVVLGHSERRHVFGESNQVRVSQRDEMKPLPLNFLAANIPLNPP